ncbi:unnamed protein product [Protopolystoma xenopodis]|uniref:Uncharacterized protein n=1 Tax=Protopolystoma xenopodis TaxID=117903 RepID=A0A3S5CR80_9PLAT|nr:unnamed protein product [Protopolystoma xenopodis]
MTKLEASLLHTKQIFSEASADISHQASILRADNPLGLSVGPLDPRHLENPHLLFLGPPAPVLDFIEGPMVGPPDSKHTPEQHPTPKSSVDDSRPPPANSPVLVLLDDEDSGCIGHSSLFHALPSASEQRAALSGSSGPNSSLVDDLFGPSLEEGLPAPLLPAVSNASIFHGNASGTGLPQS